MVDLTNEQLEGLVGLIFGDERNGVAGGSAFYLLNKCSLVGVEYIDLAPLKEYVGE